MRQEPRPLGHRAPRCAPYSPLSSHLRSCPPPPRTCPAAGAGAPAFGRRRARPRKAGWGPAPPRTPPAGRSQSRWSGRTGRAGGRTGRPPARAGGGRWPLGKSVASQHAFRAARMHSRSSSFCGEVSPPRSAWTARLRRGGGHACVCVARGGRACRVCRGGRRESSHSPPNCRVRSSRCSLALSPHFDKKQAAPPDTSARRPSPRPFVRTERERQSPTPHTQGASSTHHDHG